MGSSGRLSTGVPDCGRSAGDVAQVGRQTAQPLSAPKCRSVRTTRHLARLKRVDIGVDTDHVEQATGGHPAGVPPERLRGMTRLEVRLTRSRLRAITAGTSTRWAESLASSGPAATAYAFCALMWIPFGAAFSLLGGILLPFILSTKGPGPWTWVLALGITLTWVCLILVIATVVWRLGQARRSAKSFRRGRSHGA